MISADAVVIGAGAAGLMCAISAARRGRRVVVIEHRDKPGEKILISGGGRCNFSNLDVRAECFHGANPKFCVSALARFTNQDFIAMVAGLVLLVVFVYFIVQGLIAGGAGYVVSLLCFLFVAFINALELLVGAIQAYVFALLTSLYISDAVNLH